MRNYHKDDGSPKCSLKVDLMKAFDTVEWDFMLETLIAFRVPFRVINWVKACNTTPKFSISVNGEHAGFFHSKRGLSQAIVVKICLDDFSSLLSLEANPAKRAKVACSDICLPKIEGGLSIKDLISWDKALMIRHLWNLVHGSNNL
ncbi:hypothetical protein Ddye_005025 [Dipteronia dyeriana]|uniref:Reverse transcriptase domain-containing protein n=1 Tax=Dipteronia dyeriana TaxID=168575 RepID=A0AAD9XFS7_9ROSI|nr:hypothetical protein Ddye_005025 [Dipteronia dyeriana]